MRYLILSDIHSNWEALEAVLAATDGQYDRVVCCGDFVGYGADPNRVVDWARHAVHYSVRGNHDRACAELHNLEWFNPLARRAAEWTHDELEPENTSYLQGLPQGPVLVENFSIAHGSPFDEDDYLTNAAEARYAFSYSPTPLLFFGHSHLQGGFEAAGRHVRELPVPVNPMLQDLNPESEYMINPGSVGQPRDENPLAAYVLCDPTEGFLFFHRVPYDMETAQAKIRAAGLPKALATRLQYGK